MTLEAIVLCLALNIYYEANSEPLVGKLAVAHVTMNRAEQDEHNVCKVVYAPGQFSWTKQKNLAKPNKSDLEAAKELAALVISGETKDPTNGATYFHNTTVNPRWKTVKKTVQIGNHIFYKKVN